MKKNITLITRAKGVLLLLTLLFACQCAMADVTINSTNFPDANFMNKVKQFDTNNNGVLSTAELNAVTSMYLYNCSIYKIDGIRYFTNLVSLNCESNYLSSIDLSYNTKLESLSCRSQHGKLNYIKLPVSLKELDCSYNQNIGSLDLSGLVNLQTLKCTFCGLTSLTVASGSTNLKTIYCSDNKLSGQKMTNFLNSLPTLIVYGLLGQLYLINGDSETEENETVDVTWYSTLLSKGWYPYGNLVNNWYDYNQYLTLLATYVPINKKNFPDNNFRAYVRANCQNDGDDFLSQSEIAALQSINAPDRDIANLKGIELLTEVTTLRCFDNLLTSLDVSHNTKLTTLYCYNNSLETLKIPSGVKTLNCNGNKLSSINGLSSCSQLSFLNCANNSFITLTVSNFSKLTSLNCDNNAQLSTLQCQNNSSLSELALSNLQSLTTVYCNNNALTTLTIGNCPNLTFLNCESNQLTTLDVQENKSISELNCSNNHLLNELKLPSWPSNHIKQLFLSGCTALKNLDCSDGDLTVLDVSNCSSLATLDCSSNKLVDINMTGCSALKTLDCSSNKFQTLDLSEYSQLVKINCSRNRISSLNLSNCTLLEDLNCSSNQLEELDLSALTGLIKLNCYSNKLEELDLSAQTGLKELICSSNKLTSLNLNNPNTLQSLSCDGNKLTSLNLSGYTKLTSLYCSYNDISSLNLTGCTNLRFLYCYENELSSLNLANSTKLGYLDCSKNNLTSITMPTSCNQLNEVRCYANRLRGSAMNNLVAALPMLSSGGNEEEGFPEYEYDPEYGAFVVYFEKSEYSDGESYDIEEHNICTPQNVNDAKAKNWTVYQTNYYDVLDIYNGEEFPTAIRPSLTDTQGDDAAPQYNLGGQRVGRSYKGITIVNGKKVIRP